MSKHRQIVKTRKLKEKRSPLKRLERLTELSREIKHLKSILPGTEKRCRNLFRDAKWAQLDVDHVRSLIADAERERTELESFGKKEEEPNE